MSNGFDHLIGFIWNIANKLRGPYRPPQYRHVMLPMTVLRRMDCVLEPTKNAIREQYERLQVQQYSEDTIHKILGRSVSLHNTSQYTFKKLLDDPDNIAANLATYINSFSPTARNIFEKFKLVG